MTEPSSLPEALLPESALRRVDEVCARFENSWRIGQRPCLEEFLAGTHGPERQELLRELLRLDRHYRRSLGELVAAHEYEARFPNDVSLIQAILAEGMTVGPTRATAEESGNLVRADYPSLPPHPHGSGPVTGPWEARGAADLGELLFPIVPGYEVLAELGRGGMGVVYQARHTALKRLVALKMIRAGDYASTEELVRFQREAEAVARLRHPNIVQIYEVGEVRGSPFLSLEFVEGGSLARHLGGTPQSPRLAAGLIATLARTIHAAHQSGVVHRDLKPANVLLGCKPAATPTAAGSNEVTDLTFEAFEPKISDFGLAKHLDADSNQTQSGAIVGTPSYMAPEQAQGRGKEVGPAADVYALAAILYELLTGRPPFKGTTVRDTLDQVCTREPVPPTQLQPKVPLDLETICLKGLRKDARQRYVTAQDLADDLQRWLAGRPVLARPVPAWERAWKWARRRPALAGLAAAILVALLAGITSAVLYGLYEHQRAEARAREAEASLTVQNRYVEGQKAEAADEFAEAKGCYELALATLIAEPGAAGVEMHRSLQNGIARVSERVQEKERKAWEHLKEQERLADRHVFAERRQRFRDRYDEVRLHAVSFRDQDTADDMAAIQQEAPEALAQLGLDASAPQRLAQGLEAFRPLVESPDQLARVVEECVEVLLAWADAEVVTPAPGGPSRALRLLDGAAALGQAHGLGTSRALQLRRANCLALLGDAHGARAEHERADGLAPTTALDHFDAALTSYRAGRVAEAGTACARVLRLRSDHFWAQYLQALCYLRENRWGEAEVGLTVCLGRRPEFAWLFPLLGMAHAGLKQYDAAQADFARALEASSDPALRALALTNRSVLRIMQKRPDEAERDLREAIRLQPKVYQNYGALADLLKGRGDRAGALKLLDQALTLCPDNPALYSERARLHAENDDRAAARRDFEQVIAKEPRGSKSDRVLAACVELAHLRSLTGDHAAALADCDAALAVRPNLPAAHRQRAEVLLALGRNREASAALDQYLRVGGTPTPATHRARGLLYAQQHEYRAAVAAYSQALLLKEDAETLRDRGWAYLAQDAARPALDDFDAALRLNPKEADALAGRGTALVMRGRAADAAEATAAAEQALQAKPRTSHRLLACARIYTRAAGLLEAAARRPADDREVTRYLRRALGLLRQAIELVPVKERPKFWRDGVLADPVMLPLQRTPGMLELLRTYGG
jgi:tetratricopeptide (TPR) repeat protein